MAAVTLLALGWVSLLWATKLPLLEAVIGAGLGFLVTVRIVQHW